MSNYTNRFATVAEAIAYAEANGQGTLTIQPDGVITNQGLQYMVYDSDGNLAPGGLYQSAPGFVPAPVLEPVPVPVPEPVLEPVLEPVPVPVPEPVLEPVLEPVPEPVLEPVPPGPVLGEFGRFTTQAEAIAYAEASIQGPLTIQSDGVITNRNGEYMVYDSDGNLAPGGLYQSAAGFVPAPVATPVLGEFGRFNSVAEAMAYASGAGGQGALFVQTDGVITNQYGLIMVYDSGGNLAPGEMYQTTPVPAPVATPVLTPVLGEFGRFTTQAEAIAYAESSIQGPLTIQSDGVITNRNGEYMVYDSDGNLAPGGLYQSAPGFVPAPVGTPVFGEFGRFNSIAEAIAYATPFHGQLSVQADGSITRQQDGKIMVFDDEGNLAQGSEFYNGVLDPSLVIDPNPQTVKVYESRFATVSEAIAYAEANGQGVLTLQPDGVITNQEDNYMVYDSDGNLAPGGLYQSAAGFVPAGEFGRFNSQEEAIAYAESSIQGPLTIQLDGVITNRNGEYMVYDSDGNLAPGGRYQSVPGTGIGEFGRFSSVSEAIAYATANGQGPLSVQVDGSITSQDGKIMVYDSDGNLAPGSEFYDGILDPSLVIDPNPQPIKVYESRFATVDEALAYATANGQGILIVAGDGTITNQNGEVMVYDSDGNLAPAPNGSGSVEPVPVPAVPVSFPNSIRIPEIGSAAYKALLLETGRKDLIGFNYASHLAVKETTDGSALGMYLAAESGKELVEQLEALDLGALFANASAEQILELTEKFAQDADFQAFLSKQTTPVVPEFGTPQYSDILESTGRLDLAEFDYEEYVVSVTEAQQALIRAGLDRKYTKITVRNNSSEEDTNISDSAAKALIGSKGNETLRGGLGNDVLISSGGEDILEGGAGKDSVLIAKAASSSQITRDIETNNWVVTTEAGNDTLVGVERLIFEDTSFALDVDRDEIAGQAVLALGALVGPDSIKDPAFVGLVIGLLDDGMSFEELAMVAIERLSLQSNEALATTLWTNVIGAAPSEGELAYVVSLLDSGTTPAELIRLAAYSEANESNIDLVGLAQRGIAYSDAEG